MSRKVGSERLTHLQRILGVYPFLYTLGFRANHNWLGKERAQSTGGFLPTFIEMPLFAVPIIRFGEFLNISELVIIAVAMIAMLALDHVNQRILVRNGVGIRFEKRFDRVSFADKAWLTFYCLIFVVLCFAPVIGISPRSGT